MNRTNRTQTIRKGVRFESDGVRAVYDVVKRGERYEVDMDLGQGFRSIHVGQFAFDRPSKYQTIAHRAHEVAVEALDAVIAASTEDALYLVISDMPGFADDALGEHTMAGYEGHRDGGPRYVVRCADAAEVAAVRERVEAIGHIEDGGRHFDPKVVDVTANAYEALDESPWMATDPRTFIAARRVEETLSAGIPG